MTAPEKDRVTRERRELKTAAVLFVENSKGGVLAKNIREVLERIHHILGYRIKVVERAGTPLSRMFPLSKIGEGKECGRQDCITCTQESRGVYYMKTSADYVIREWGERRREN